MSVYDGVVLDPSDPAFAATPLDEETYVQVWQPVAERQVVLAGYRIAEVMKEIFP